MGNGNMLKSKESELREALSEPRGDEGWGEEDEEGHAEEAVESSVIVVSKKGYKKIGMTNKSKQVQDCGAASHDIIIEGREDYQMRQSLGIC